MELWLLSLVFGGCLALPGMPSPHHPGQELIDLARQTTYSEISSRIVGGVDAYINEFPWQASLQLSNNHICGAIVLSEDFVLTAAHCVGNSASAYKIRMGVTSRSSTAGLTLGVSAVVPHEDFQNQADTAYGAFPNDVAIMKLTESIEFTENIQPISLTSVTNAQLANYADSDCWISGWGKTNGNSNNLPEYLQKTSVNIMTDSACISSIGSAYVNGDIHICVDGTGSSGGCNGDSGGPLMCKVGGQYELAGVTSFVLGSCLTSYPTVYAETYAFRGWVQTKMSNM